MKFKRGELTTQQIVMIVVLIASFAIILFFLFRLNLGNETESQICHNSVVMRGNSILKESVPLNCKTEYICISKNGDCGGMKSSEVVKVKDLDGVYEVLADSLADCWWTFGEGKINYVGSDFKRNHYCSICSQIKFDKDITEINGLENGEIDKETFYKEYMNKTNISSSNKQTYAEYLFGTNEIDKLKLEISSSTQEAGTTFGKINVNNEHYVIMGVVSNVDLVKAFGALGAGTIIGANLVKLTNGVTPKWVKGVIIVGAIAYTAVASVHTPEVLSIMRQGDGIDNTFMVPTIIEADSDKFKSLNCEDVNTLA